MSSTVVEIANLRPAPGRADELASRLPAALAIVAAAPGCNSVAAYRAIEDPSALVVAIDWDRVENHRSFRRTDEFLAYRGELGEALGGVELFHYELLYATPDGGPMERKQD